MSRRFLYSPVGGELLSIDCKCGLEPYLVAKSTNNGALPCVRTIGSDIKTVQYGWPIGMPVARKLDTGLWEIRSRLAQRISRILFTVRGDTMVLLHGFIKKSQKTPKEDLQLAKDRKANLEK